MNDCTLVILVNRLESPLMSRTIRYKGIFKEILFICQTSLMKSYPATIAVVETVFEYDFAKLRNLAMSRVKTKWVFFLDSDESLSTDLRVALPRLMDDEEKNGYWFSRKTFIAPEKYLRYGLFYPDYQLRLIRVSPKYRFVGAVHESITIPKERTMVVNLDILHYPHNPKYTSFSDFENMTQYIGILKVELTGLRLPPLIYVVKGMQQGLFLFFSGFFRGKGFLDGWAGFRAHILFAGSIFLSYIEAARIIMKGKK